MLGRWSSHTSSTIRRPQLGGHAAVGRVDGRDRRRARQRQPERLDGGGHRRGGAHCHAVPGRAGDPVLELPPRAFAEFARPGARPRTARRRCRCRRLARASCRGASDPRGGRRPAGRLRSRPSRAPAWSCRSRPSGLRRRSDSCGAPPRSPSRGSCGTSSPTASGTARPARATGISSGKPPADQTPRRTCSARSRKWRVAAGDVAPGVEDRDHRTARELLERVAHLLDPRAMAERPQRVGPEPAMTPKLLGGASRP